MAILCKIKSKLKLEHVCTPTSSAGEALLVAMRYMDSSRPLVVHPPCGLELRYPFGQVPTSS